MSCQSIKIKVKELGMAWESKDQSKFYAMIVLLFGWLFLSIAYNSISMKLSGTGFCFGYSMIKFLQLIK